MRVIFLQLKLQSFQRNLVVAVGAESVEIVEIVGRAESEPAPLGGGPENTHH